MIGMIQIQVELEKRDTKTVRTEMTIDGRKSMVDTVDIWIVMIPRGQGVMMTRITIQGGIMNNAILEMNIETEGVAKCKVYQPPYCNSH
jgi:hypothetical protein